MAGLIIVGVIAAYVLVCVIAGFGSAGTLATFRPDSEGVERRFRQAPDAVVVAFERAARTTPGMRPADHRPGELLVDLRPTVRVLGGDFGTAIRVRVQPCPEGTAVRIDGRRKVPFALAQHRAAFVHAERALRQQAKRAGIDELIAGVNA